MKTWQKAVFIIVLIVFVSASVTISLISISRPAYKYREETALGGDESLNGWVFANFNGNAGAKELNIDFVRDSSGQNPDESKPVIGVGHYAVNADEYLEEIHIGASVRYIDETAFFNAKKLRSITVDEENQWFEAIDGVLFSKDGKKLILYPVCKDQRPGTGEEEFSYPDSYVVPDGVERICSFAFLKNGYLRDVTLPDTLKEIGDMAFFDCGKLGRYEYNAETDTLLGTGFALPDGVEKIGADALSKCPGITPVLFIPASVTAIEHHALFGGEGMKDILMGAADDSNITLGDAWLPKNIKKGPVKVAPKPQYGKTREDSEELIKAYRQEALNKGREEAKDNG